MKSRQFWLPVSLKDHRAAVDIGLYYLSIGRRPSVIPDEEKSNVRVRLSDRGIELLTTLVPDQFPSESQAIAHALAWLARQPEHVKQATMQWRQL